MNKLRSLFLNSEFLINTLVVTALLYFIFNLLPIGILVAHAKEDTGFFAYVLAIVSGVIKGAYQPAILLVLAKLIELKTKA